MAIADPTNSEFFETNNTESVLAKHRIPFAQNRTVVFRDASIEDSFKACVDQARVTVFLSYKWCEERKFAVELAQEFRRNGVSPWLDALSIPDYEAAREPGVSEQRLKDLIKLGIEKSKLAVVINSEKFAKSKGDWTAIELTHIRAKGIFLIQIMRGGKERRCGESPIVSENPKWIVREVLTRLGQCADTAQNPS